MKCKTDLYAGVVIVIATLLCILPSVSKAQDQKVRPEPSPWKQATTAALIDFMSKDYEAAMTA